VRQSLILLVADVSVLGGIEETVGYC